MPRFAANLSMMFRDRPFLDRFSAARAAGFDGVEVLFPYDEPGPLIRERLADNQLTFVMMNAPPPNYTGRARGFAAVPGDEGHFLTDFRRASRAADALRAEKLHIMAGVSDAPAARETMVNNLRLALETDTDHSLTIEPINTDDVPGYFLSSFDLAAEIIAEVGSPRLGIQFDMHHARRMGIDPLGTFDRYAGLVSHIQISGGLDRLPPERGDRELIAFLDAVEASCYDGWVSGEYRSSEETETTLWWIN